ncbi:MAG: hypothetical protein LC643_03700, partial [Bacteroidales bacterium]|nr:hypothetical protein [Bacteroidales bacterium]
MNKLMRLFSYALITATLFTACDKDDDNPSSVNEEIEGCYILNYGSNGGGSITRYNYAKESLTLNYFEKQNNQTLASKLQYGALYNNHIYLMGNDADEVITVDKLFKPVANAAKTDIAKPRFFVGDGKYLYISCLGADPDWKTMPDSYIAKFNTETNSVEETISLPGGPEGLSIVGGKLYAALNYANRVAVIDLNDHAISYIEMPASTSYFVKDLDNNLYVTLVSTPSNHSSEAGLGFINTTDNTLDETYPLDGVSSNYSAIVAPSKDLSTIYIVAASYVKISEGNWEQQGAVHTFDVKSKQFEIFAGNLTGPNGVAINPDNDNVYILTATSTT